MKRRARKNRIASLLTEAHFSNLLSCLQHGGFFSIENDMLKLALQYLVFSLVQRMFCRQKLRNALQTSLEEVNFLRDACK
jgi:hypothetical protein